MDLIIHLKLIHKADLTSGPGSSGTVTLMLFLWESDIEPSLLSGD